jgi:hypothetical protein
VLEKTKLTGERRYKPSASRRPSLFVFLRWAEALGRYAPFVGLAADAYATVKLGRCLFKKLWQVDWPAKEFEDWTIGSLPNFFEQQLALGRTISSVSFAPQDMNADDDYLIFTFKDDAAAAPLRLPDQLKTESKSEPHR